MAPRPQPTSAPNRPETLLAAFVSGERGRALRAQLTMAHPRRSPEEIEDAVQTACERFVKHVSEMPDPGEVYAWVRTTAHRLLNREDDVRGREIPVDPIGGGLERAPAEDPGPAERLIAHEDELDMEALVGEVADALPESRREILALYVAGYKRPEIAARLGISERVVKRYLLEVMDEARAVLARRAGGGCPRGEPLVLRFTYGLATSAEAAQARMHLDGCHRCESLYERLLDWREKAAALLPLPAAEAASPGLLGRLAHKAAEGVGAIKQQVLGGAAQLKQHAAAAYYRAVDPTPLAGAKPAAVAAVVAGCLTIGGGATYCVQQGVDPLGAATGLVAGGEEQKPEAPAASSEPAEPPTPTYEPAPPPSTATEEAAPAPEEAPASEPEPEQVAATPEPEPPPPEQTFEPASPDYPATEAASDASETESTATESARPAPVPAHSPPQFGGP
jgi:RNA polymerase sigma factor (sigma-70 family)